MKVGDLVRFHLLPDKGYGIVIKSTSRSVRVCWDSGYVFSVWKLNLKVINESR